VRLALRCVCVLGTLCLLGCNPNGPVEVAGKVTYDGKPVESGTIMFEPEDKSGPTQGQAISKGEYRLTGQNAVAPGKKIVRIEAHGPSGKKVPSAPGSSTMVDAFHQFIPEKYNKTSDIKKTIEPGKPMTLDFDLQK